MINRNRYRKLNDKKILHKKNKRWIVVSTALLGLIGGGAMMTAPTHADSTNQGNNGTQTAQKAPSNPVANAGIQNNTSHSSQPVQSTIHQMTSTEEPTVHQAVNTQPHAIYTPGEQPHTDNQQMTVPIQHTIATQQSSVQQPAGFAQQGSGQQLNNSHEASNQSPIQQSPQQTNVRHVSQQNLNQNHPVVHQAQRPATSYVNTRVSQVATSSNISQRGFNATHPVKTTVNNSNRYPNKQGIQKPVHISEPEFKANKNVLNDINTDSLATKQVLNRQDVNIKNALHSYAWNETSSAHKQAVSADPYAVSNSVSSAVSSNTWQGDSVSSIDVKASSLHANLMNNSLKQSNIASSAVSSNADKLDSIISENKWNHNSVSIPGTQVVWPGQMYIGGNGSETVHSDAEYTVPSDVSGFAQKAILASGQHQVVHKLDTHQQHKIRPAETTPNWHMNNLSYGAGLPADAVSYQGGQPLLQTDEVKQHPYSLWVHGDGNLYRLVGNPIGTFTDTPSDGAKWDIFDPSCFMTIPAQNSDIIDTTTQNVNNIANVSFNRLYRTLSGNDYAYINNNDGGWIKLGNLTPSAPWRKEQETDFINYKFNGNTVGHTTMTGTGSTVANGQGLPSDYTLANDGTQDFNFDGGTQNVNVVRNMNSSAVASAETIAGADSNALQAYESNPYIRNNPTASEELATDGATINSASNAIYNDRISADSTSAENAEYNVTKLSGAYSQASSLAQEAINNAVQANDNMNHNNTDNIVPNNPGSAGVPSHTAENQYDFNVHIITRRPNGVGGYTDDGMLNLVVPLSITGKQGDKFSVNSLDSRLTSRIPSFNAYFSPDASDQDVSGTITSNGLAPNNITYYYNENSDGADANGNNNAITIDYVDAGGRIVQSGQVRGAVDQTFTASEAVPLIDGYNFENQSDIGKTVMVTNSPQTVRIVVANQSVGDDGNLSDGEISSGGVNDMNNNRLDTDVINYIYDGSQVGSTVMKGTDGITDTADGSNMTTGYRLADDGSQSFVYDNGTHRVNVIPINDSNPNQFTPNEDNANDQLNFIYGDNILRTAILPGQRGMTETIANNLIPNGYQLANNQPSTFTFDNGAHSIFVAPFATNTPQSSNSSTNTTIASAISSAINSFTSASQSTVRSQSTSASLSASTSNSAVASSKALTSSIVASVINSVDSSNKAQASVQASKHSQAMNRSQANTSASSANSSRITVEYVSPSGKILESHDFYGRNGQQFNGSFFSSMAPQGYRFDRIINPISSYDSGAQIMEINVSPSASSSIANKSASASNTSNNSSKNSATSSTSNTSISSSNSQKSSFASNSINTSSASISSSTNSSTNSSTSDSADRSNSSSISSSTDSQVSSSANQSKNSVASLTSEIDQIAGKTDTGINSNELHYNPQTTSDYTEIQQAHNAYLNGYDDANKGLQANPSHQNRTDYMNGYNAYLKANPGIQQIMKQRRNNKSSNKPLLNKHTIYQSPVTNHDKSYSNAGYSVGSGYIPETGNDDAIANSIGEATGYDNPASDVTNNTGITDNEPEPGTYYDGHIVYQDSVGEYIIVNGVKLYWDPQTQSFDLIYNPQTGQLEMDPNAQQLLQDSDGQSSDSQASDNQASDSQPSDNQSSDGTLPSNELPTNTEND